MKKIGLDFDEETLTDETGFHFFENIAPNKTLQRDAPQAARP